MRANLRDSDAMEEIEFSIQLDFSRSISVTKFESETKPDQYLEENQKQNHSESESKLESK